MRRPWVYRRLKGISRGLFRKYHINKNFNTPIINKITLNNLDDAIIVYPEIVNGNPLRGKRVVRWFLHNPGYHTGQIHYGKNELYYSYGSFGLDFLQSGSMFSSLTLEVTHFFREHYNMDGVVAGRTGTAYCLRKGKGREIVHNINDSILIDNKSHSEVASIFKKSKYFISYDLYTAYTWFAILCGCIPIVVPEEGLKKDAWHRDPNLSYGIAYGFDETLLAIEQRDKAIDILNQKEFKTMDNVKKFINETEQHFRFD